MNALYRSKTQFNVSRDPKMIRTNVCVFFKGLTSQRLVRKKISSWLILILITLITN